ncbi:caspase family protein [Nocardioides sp. CGMCC 1.13656]|nr:MULTISPECIES: caspase family protein [unclassified Nocardioides]MBA2953404.1 caspase family protein [Nocardioides sp. CGMCC 1.13656]
MGSRYALIVATDRYSDAGLRELAAPAHDAEALAAVLGDPAVGDFDVATLSNQSAQDVRMAVEDFFADRDRSDTLLLHFSGHGLKNAAGELFLAAADTRPGRLASTGIGSDFLSRQMADSRAERIVLLLDCCYGGAFPRGMVVRAAGEAQVLEAFAAQSDVAGGKGRAVVTASSAMEYSFEEGSLTDDASGSPSVFTGALVDALASGEADTDGDGWVGLHELFEYVSSAVRTVNPHQTPHMWTFGSQGELLIARSRVRRVRPTPLSDELAEALVSPLAATRFGVVDLLRQRLVGDDLGLAATALETLRQLVHDDSRRVAEAAAGAVDAAVPRTTPSAVHLIGDESGAGAAEVTVEGPPLALAGTVTSTDPRIRAVYAEPVIGIVVQSRAGEPVSGSVTVEGPCGSVGVPVELVAATTSPRAADPPRATPPVSPPPPPARALPPEAPRRPAAAEPARDRSESAMVRWAAGGLLALSGLVLLYVNRPGDPEQYKAFYDEAQSGWYVYRSPDDSWVLASVVCIVSAVLSALARNRPRHLALGALLGGSLYLFDDGFAFLALGFAYADGVAKWRTTLVVSASIAAAVLVLVRPRLSPPARPAWLPLGMLAAGAVLVMGNEVIALDDTSPLDVFGPLVYLSIAIVTLLAAAAMCSPDRRTREVLGVAAATMQVVALYGTFGWRTSDQLGPHMAVMLPGTLLILGAIAFGALRPAQQPVVAGT